MFGFGEMLSEANVYSSIVFLIFCIVTFFLFRKNSSTDLSCRQQLWVVIKRHFIWDLFAFGYVCCFLLSMEFVHAAFRDSDDLASILLEWPDMFLAIQPLILISICSIL